MRHNTIAFSEELLMLLFLARLKHNVSSSKSQFGAVELHFASLNGLELQHLYEHLTNRFL